MKLQKYTKHILVGLAIVAVTALVAAKKMKRAQTEEQGAQNQRGEITDSSTARGESGGDNDGYVGALSQGLKRAQELNKESYTVDLHGRGLTSFPEEILDRTNAKILILSDNKIVSIPAEIGRLINLEELYLNNNVLTGALPAEIRHFQKLKILEARGNRLTGIPAEIGQLKSLQHLDLSRNSLDTFPQEIVNLADSLKTLDLSGNKYSQEQQDAFETLLPQTEVIFE